MKHIIMNQLDGNNTFEVEGSDVHEAAFAALSELGWSVVSSEPNTSSKVPMYQVIARKIWAMKNCLKSDNDQWYQKHKEAVENLVKDHFPHGSGIDAGFGEFDYDKCTDKKLVFCCEYHFMDEHGFYDGWYHFKITVTPSLSYGLQLKVGTLARMRSHGIDEHLAEMYHDVFTMKVDEYPVTKLDE